MARDSYELVSIVTPAFDAAAHLSETIQSTLQQTYPHFEQLIVDDGSTDRTAEIAEMYVERDSRIRVFRTPNRGMSAARNFAVEHARGRFIALLDSDDVWMRTYLEAQLRTLAQHASADVVTANTINMGGRLDGTPYWPALNEVRPISTLEMIVREDAVQIMSVFRRSVIDRIGVFDTEFRGNEDYQFWLRAAIAGCRFVADFTPRAYYRRRADSVSSDERHMLVGIIRVLNQVRPLCSPGSAEVQAIDSQLRRFQRRLLVAEARECIATGNALGGLAFLERIPDGDRGPSLSLALRIAALWPEALSIGYRTRRVLRRARRHALSMRA